jgi:hypothetical protein
MRYIKLETIQNYDSRSYVALLDGKITGLCMGLFAYLTQMEAEEKSISS